MVKEVVHVGGLWLASSHMGTFDKGSGELSFEYTMTPDTLNRKQSFSK